MDKDLARWVYRQESWSRASHRSSLSVEKDGSALWANPAGFAGRIGRNKDSGCDDFRATLPVFR